VKERPILFKGEMVREILAGTKTQTRRLMKPQPPANACYWQECSGGQWLSRDYGKQWNCLHGSAGDRLWVKETWATDWIWNDFKPTDVREDQPILYRADEHATGVVPFEWGRWRPSLFMRRWMSRITLEITAVRVERLHDITEADARAEGVEAVYSPDMLSIFTTKGHACDIAPTYIHGVPKVGDEWMGARVTSVEPNPGSLLDTARDGYRKLWESINGAGSWASNPWVWVVEFKRL